MEPDSTNIHGNQKTDRKLFNIEDIRSICFDLGIDYDNIRGETKESKVRELLIYMGQRNEIQRLIARCRELRPKANWDDYNPA